MVRAACCLFLLLSTGCAAESADVERDDCVSCAPASAPPVEHYGVAINPRLTGAERCEAVARSYLPSAPDQAWRALWQCVDAGQFTELRSLLQDAWDHELRTRRDAPILIARVIAERGGNVEGDLRLLHDRRIALFGLAQAMARPELFRGALVVFRARFSDHGVVDETRIVSQPWDVPLSPIDRITTQAAAPFAYDTRRLTVARRYHNLDVPTGTRALASIDGDPFVDADEPVVVLGRFDGMRAADGWPAVTVLQHFRPSATVAY